jgi:hypothetical protein
LTHRLFLLICLCAQGKEPAEIVDYTRLSIRELKALLTSRGVSLAGLVERADLVQACRESEDMGEGAA